jgi:hypothetical protein
MIYYTWRDGLRAWVQFIASITFKRQTKSSVSLMPTSDFGLSKWLLSFIPKSVLQLHMSTSMCFKLGGLVRIIEAFL